MNMVDAEFIQQSYKLLPVFLSLTGAFVSFFVYSFANSTLFLFKISFVGKKIYNFLNKKWYFDKVYNTYFGQTGFSFGYGTSYKIIDRGVFEVFGPMGLSSTVYKSSLKIIKSQSNFIYHYSLMFLIGSVVILGLSKFWVIFGGFIDYRLLFIIFITSFFLIK